MDERLHIISIEVTSWGVFRENACILIHGYVYMTYVNVKCKCKCIQSFVERRLQDDQRPFTRVPGNTSYMQNTVSL